MSVMPQTIAKTLNKHPRTIRRWCELGIIPGAYRKHGNGHWRIRRFNLRELFKVIERLKKFARVRAPFPKGDRPLFDKELFQMLADGGQERHTRASRLLLATHGLSEETLSRERLTSDQKRILDNTPLHRAITPNMREAARLPYSDLHIAAQKMLARSPSGKGLTVRSLARELKTSRMTLYRKHGQKKLRGVLNFALKQAMELPSDRISTSKKRH